MLFKWMLPAVIFFIKYFDKDSWDVGYGVVPFGAVPFSVFMRILLHFSFLPVYPVSFSHQGTERPLHPRSGFLQVHISFRFRPCSCQKPQSLQSGNSLAPGSIKSAQVHSAYFSFFRHPVHPLKVTSCKAGIGDTVIHKEHRILVSVPLGIVT